MLLLSIGVVECKFALRLSVLHSPVFFFLYYFFLPYFSDRLFFLRLCVPRNYFFFFKGYGDPRDLPSSPPRPSSDLARHTTPMPDTLRSPCPRRPVAQAGARRATTLPDS